MAGMYGAPLQGNFPYALKNSSSLVKQPNPERDLLSNLLSLVYIHLLHADKS